MGRLLTVLRQFFDDDGAVLSNGWLAFYESGTSTPKTIYSDSAMSVARTNPLQLDADARCPAIYGEGAYRVVLHANYLDPVLGNIPGVVVDSFDEVYPPLDAATQFENDWVWGSGTCILTSTGLIGVGTLTPDSGVSVNANNIVIKDLASSNGMTILSSPTGYSEINFGDGVDSSTYRKGRVWYGHELDALYLFSNNEVGVTVDANQRVGIGYTAPSYAGAMGTLVLSDSADGDVGLTFKTSNTGANKATINFTSTITATSVSNGLEFGAGCGFVAYTGGIPVYKAVRDVAGVQVTISDCEEFDADDIDALSLPFDCVVACDHQGFSRDAGLTIATSSTSEGVAIAFASDVNATPSYGLMRYIPGTPTDTMRWSLNTDTIDVLALIAPSSAGQTSLQVYDYDNAGLEQVTVGAANSGGAGYKLLRIPN